MNKKVIIGIAILIFIIYIFLIIVVSADKREIYSDPNNNLQSNDTVQSK